MGIQPKVSGRARIAVIAVVREENVDDITTDSDNSACCSLYFGGLGEVKSCRQSCL